MIESGETSVIPTQRDIGVAALEEACDRNRMPMPPFRPTPLHIERVDDLSQAAALPDARTIGFQHSPTSALPT